jgi:hypothetical protein
MPAPSHHFHRHPALPWAELRISRQSCYSYRLHMHEYSIGIVDEGETLFHHDDGPEPIERSVVLIEPGPGMPATRDLAALVLPHAVRAGRLGS